MIFYFTGTGNSLAAAKKLQGRDEALINMADANREGRQDYQVNPGEPVGFVFPVYFYSLPTVVMDFIDALRLEGAEYVYSVITCGGGISQAGAVLRKRLQKRNVRLDYVTALLMPDNYILLYSNKAEGWEPLLAKADERLLEIANDIAARKRIAIKNHTVISDVMAGMYRRARKTAKFYAEDACTGCGMCARNCPENAIEIENGRPVWKKDTCAQCLACINRCPVRAIQYGRRTRKQGRYVHPDL